MTYETSMAVPASPSGVEFPRFAVSFLEGLVIDPSGTKTTPTSGQWIGKNGLPWLERALIAMPPRTSDMRASPRPRSGGRTEYMSAEYLLPVTLSTLSQSTTTGSGLSGLV